MVARRRGLRRLRRPERPGFRALLAGIERADSVTLDPHKWLFHGPPWSALCALVRDGAALERTFAIHPDYLDDNGTADPGEVNFADRGLSLSRGFRALKVGMSVQTYGLAAFRQAIEANLTLAKRAETLVTEQPTLTLMAPAGLGIVCFRREWPGHDEAEIEARGLDLVRQLEAGGRALVSSTRLAGRHAVRLCVLNPTSTEADVGRVVEHFATAQPHQLGQPGRVPRPGRSPGVGVGGPGSVWPGSAGSVTGGRRPPVPGPPTRAWPGRPTRPWPAWPAVWSPSRCERATWWCGATTPTARST